MKYNDTLKRPRNDRRLKNMGMRCPGCDAVFYAKNIIGVERCNKCGYVRQENRDEW